jgi:hypothetical protein
VDDIQHGCEVIRAKVDSNMNPSDVPGLTAITNGKPHRSARPVRFAVIAILMTLVSISCGAQMTNRERAINAALLQPAEMPMDWGFRWFNRSEGGCPGWWNVFHHGDDEPNVTHVILDCTDITSAKALYLSQQSPHFSNSSSSIISYTHPPKNSDEYYAWCEIVNPGRRLAPDIVVSEKYCRAVARYGRVVSMMEVNAILPTTTWPLEADLIKWVVERSDTKLAKLKDIND